MFAKQGARGQRRPTMQMNQGNPFGGMFQAGPAFMPPPQMMFMPPMPPPPMFQGGGYAPQQIRVQPGFQPPGFQAPGFSGFQPMNNAFRPIMPMPGPTFMPNNQPQGFGGYVPQMQRQGGFGFQQPPQQSGFQQPGFQQPGFQPQGFQQPGFQPPQQNFGFQPPAQNQSYY